MHFGGLNFLSIAVQPTWDSPESLMGYFNAIENKFDATEFLRFFIQTTLSNDEYLKAETFNRWINKKGDQEAKLEGKYKKLTEEINERLSACGRSIGHRVWQSMSTYMHNHPLVLHASDKNKALEFAYEECLVLKIFPKLRGVQTRNNQHLTKIQNLLKDFSVSSDFKQAMENDSKEFVFNSANYLNNAKYEKLLKK